MYKRQVLYRVKNVTTTEDIKNELAKHTFTLVCYTDDIKSGDTILKLYLRYKVEDEPAAIACLLYTSRCV